MMSMFCYQCQETAGNKGCTRRGVCGKTDTTAGLQDLLIHLLKGIAVYAEKTAALGAEIPREYGRFICEGLFATITNANFDEARFIAMIRRALALRDRLAAHFSSVYRNANGRDFAEALTDCATWHADDPEAFHAKAREVGVLATGDEDMRSLRELVVYGLKGMAAYADHAAILGYESDAIYSFMFKALAATTRDIPVEEMVSLVLETGRMGVETMALLDKANTATYGKPDITKVNLGVRNNPAILISGHDLKDLEELLQQTDGTGIDVYTHGEMLPAHYYPAFKKYSHLAGNYGNAWWQQDREFAAFNGPIIMTTNCIIPVKEAYKDRIFTTGVVGYPGVKHIPDRPAGGAKDYSEVIELARKCPPPSQLETGTITGGFAHDQVLALSDKIAAAVKSGKIRRFIVMAGCDGRHKSRTYYTEVARNLPQDTVILTAGCAKYRYNKLDLGQIEGIPRVLDAGQCNDSYSLALIALKLKDLFGLENVNDLPLSFDIAWYEQKAVIVLLALLYLGFKGIRLGPTLPAFLSPAVAKVLVERFDLKPIGDVQDDIAAMLAGK